MFRGLWTLSMFFYEIKCIVSLVMIFQLFYLIRGFDSLLLAYITDFFQRKAQLHALLNDVKLDVINGTLEIKNIKHYHPIHPMMKVMLNIITMGTTK